VVLILSILISSSELISILPILSLFTLATYKLLPALNVAFTRAASLSHNLPVIDSISQETSIQTGLLKPIAALNTVQPLDFNREIQVDHVSYQYKTANSKVLDNISLNIPKSSRCALVGSTGCGKSTLINLMVGLVFADSGSIKIDGQAIVLENVDRWQKQIAYVPQEVFLYDETITANIALGIPKNEIDLDRVRKAADLAQATTFIESDTPNGFDSIVGENGVRLSGGQRQRLGLARAFYRQPSVIILDEATSALDNVTEEAVIDAIEEQLADVTLVMIAHRLSTVQMCDRIFFIENGQVSNSGTYQELTRTCDAFKKMLQAGTLNAAKPEASAKHI